MSKDQPSVPVQHFVSNGWHVAATRNFRIHHRADLTSSSLQRLASHLETQRHTIGSTWLGAEFAATWSVTCDVYLHQTDLQYEQHSGMPVETVGYSRLKVGRGKVWSRQLDLRWHRDHTRTFDVASHELTHIVLADRFCWRQIPRWADEGIAITVETGDRRERLANVLQDAVEANRLFSIRDLLTARNYPSDRQLADLFYAQSASLVAFLAEAHGYQQVLRLAEMSTEQDVSVAVASVTNWRDATELETRWQAWLRQSRKADSLIVAQEK
ncbi:MAG: hypothetical protein HQ518_06970 [Rhodopirellula sp.]|nr:hypothetical protein [Rhodopirellula sp.]